MFFAKSDHLGRYFPGANSIQRSFSVEPLRLHTVQTKPNSLMMVGEGAQSGSIKLVAYRSVPDF